MRLIDADAMVETLKRKYPQWYTGKPKDSWMHYAWLVYHQAVENAPTIDATPIKHGHWLYDYCDIVCSECGTRYNDELCYMLRSDCSYNEPRYCPWCGARMDAKE